MDESESWVKVGEYKIKIIPHAFRCYFCAIGISFTSAISCKVCLLTVMEMILQCHPREAQ